MEAYLKPTNFQPAAQPTASTLALKLNISEAQQNSPASAPVSDRSTAMAVDPSTVNGEQMRGAHESAAVHMQQGSRLAPGSLLGHSQSATTDRTAPEGYEAPGFATTRAYTRPAGGKILTNRAKGAASCAEHTSFEASCAACKQAHNGAVRRQVPVQPQQTRPIRFDRPPVRNYEDRQYTDGAPPPPDYASLAARPTDVLDRPNAEASPYSQYQVADAMQAQGIYGTRAARRGGEYRGDSHTERQNQRRHRSDSKEPRHRQRSPRNEFPSHNRLR